MLGLNFAIVTCAFKRALEENIKSSYIDRLGFCINEFVIRNEIRASYCKQDNYEIAGRSGAAFSGLR